jgi:hypothetical protein
MNDILAKFKLFSFLRKGLVPGSSATDQDGEVSIDLIIKRSENGGSDSTEKITKDLKTYGPGDIVGIDQRLVVRTCPEKDVYDFETTNIVAIEFSRPDFPWMFTPQKPVDDKLQPWLVLIVVKTNEAQVSNNPRNPLPILTINNVSGHNLPDLDDSWSYAHVQGDEDVSKSDIDNNLESLLSNTPERLISRIVCPQALEANTKYTAFLVPAYKSGVKAGLGEEFSGQQNEKAWTGSEQSLRLPIYYQWEFETGEQGDFKTLVRKLEGRQLPEGVGAREMDVSNPGAGMDFSEESPVLFESALMPPGFTAESNPNRIKEVLRNFLNKPTSEEMEGPVLGPPLYGNHQANRDFLHDDEVSRTWFNALNEDPRNRATAGLGTKVIQNDQEHLMHSAWEQVGDLKRVNEYFKQAQTARSAGTVLHKKHLSKLPVTSFLQVTNTVQSRIVDPDNGHTVAHTIKSGRIPKAFFSGTFQRLLRPKGNLAKSLYGENGLTGVSKLLDDLNTGRLNAEPDQSPPDGMVTPESAENPFPEPNIPIWLKGKLASIKRIVKALAIGLLILFFLLVYLETIPLALIVFVLLLVSSFIVKWLRDRLQEEQLYENHTPESYTGDSIRELDPPENFQIEIGDEDSITGPNLGITFQETAAKTLDDFYFIPAEEQIKKEELNLSDIRRRVLDELNPVHSIPKRVRARISVPEHLLNPDDPIEPIKAAPYFPQPMYTALRDLSKDFLLSGLDKIPRNTVTIAQANRPFIESYMTGINHEMGRELLWRGYPTELRATYFQQFWDASDRMPQEELTEEENRALAKDIDYIHRWRKTLGEHPPGMGSQGKDVSTTPLVLMIRGDLLQRYPNTVIYAVKAKKSEDDSQTDRVPDSSDDNNVKIPIFKGSIGSDISFFGFDFSPDEVLSEENSSDSPDQNKGWFFVLQEPISDLSFKLPSGFDFSALVQTKQNAADVAKSIYNEPTLFAIHADGLIK